MKSQENKRDAFEKLTGWLEQTEQMSLEELREIRRTMGHDVESSEKQFVAFLENLTTNSTEAVKPFAILSCAASKQLSLVQLANAVELSVALVTKLDRRLIRFSSIPGWVLQKVSEVLSVAEGTLAAYLQQGAAFATGAEYRADEAPSLPEQQDFFDAVQSDKTLSEQRRTFLLGLRPE